MTDPDRRASAKAVFLMTKLTDPCEDEMCTLVPPFSGLTDPPLETNKKKMVLYSKSKLGIKHGLRKTSSYNW